MWFIPASNLPWQIAENVSAKALKLCMSFSLEKTLIDTLFCCFVDLCRLNKIM